MSAHSIANLYTGVLIGTDYLHRRVLRQRVIDRGVIVTPIDRCARLAVLCSDGAGRSDDAAQWNINRLGCATYGRLCLDPIIIINFNDFKLIIGQISLTIIAAIVSVCRCIAGPHFISFDVGWEICIHIRLKHIEHGDPLAGRTCTAFRNRGDVSGIFPDRQLHLCAGLRRGKVKRRIGCTSVIIAVIIHAQIIMVGIRRLRPFEFHAAVVNVVRHKDVVDRQHWRSRRVRDDERRNPYAWRFTAAAAHSRDIGRIFALRQFDRRGGTAASNPPFAVRRADIINAVVIHAQVIVIDVAHLVPCERHVLVGNIFRGHCEGRRAGSSCNWS